MKISVRAYEEKDLPEMIRIWNEVVADGVAFPQEELLNAETQAEVQLWKYDPSILAKNGFVDSLSLALSFQKPADTFLKKD